LEESSEKPRILPRPTSPLMPRRARRAGWSRRLPPSRPSTSNEPGPATAPPRSATPGAPSARPRMDCDCDPAGLRHRRRARARGPRRPVGLCVHRSSWDDGLMATAARATVEQEARSRLALILTGLMLVLLIAALDQTIVATALPTIVGDLGGLDHISWVTSAFL